MNQEQEPSVADAEKSAAEGLMELHPDADIETILDALRQSPDWPMLERQANELHEQIDEIEARIQHLNDSDPSVMEKAAVAIGSLALAEVGGATLLLILSLIPATGQLSRQIFEYIQSLSPMHNLAAMAPFLGVLLTAPMLHERTDQINEAAGELSERMERLNKAIEHARMLSDKELLESGASVENGVLLATPEQKEAARTAMQADLASREEGNIPEQG